MSKRNDYTSYSFLLTLLVVSMTIVLGFIPGRKVNGHYIKRANILSDVVRIGEKHAELRLEDDYLPTDTLLFAESVPFASDPFIPYPAPQTSLTATWDLGGVAGTNPGDPQAVVRAAAGSFVPVEEFANDNAMHHFYEALSHAATRTIRIAVLGDSFTEGDIVTADLREQFQKIYGGRGVGFIPFTSPVAKYRGSIKHTFDGWKTYNLIQKANAPEELRDRFFVSGYLNIPGENAVTRLEGVTFRKNLDEWSLARILFVNEGESRVEVTVNGSQTRTFEPEQDGNVQQIVVRGGNIRNIEVKVAEPEGFIGYGIILEDPTGVSVDSYSLRSNSGTALFGTNGQINRQINDLAGFDLIVLQYGLNVMSPEVAGYRKYGEQISQLIDFLRVSFPQSSVLVMGVGDRAMQEEGEFVTMPSVEPMLSAQRAAAQRSGAAFWNTFRAMGGDGAMGRYVERGWAAKDYTHIGYAGGRAIARELVKALEQGRFEYLERRAAQDTVSHAADSLRGVLPDFSVAADTTRGGK